MNALEALVIALVASIGSVLMVGCLSGSPVLIGLGLVALWLGYKMLDCEIKEK